MEYKDYYEIMGVKRDATQDEIKRSYRKLARKYHPDVSKESDAEERFKAVGEAYEVLKDPEKRAAYDQLGANWQAGQDFKPPPDWDAGFEFSGGGYTAGGAGAHSDFFDQLFGQQFRQAGGGGRRRTFHMRGEDHHAKVLIDLEDSFAGATRSMSLHVPELTEDGHVVTRERTLNVRIPKGIRPGQQIRLAGQGAPGMGRRVGRPVPGGGISGTPIVSRRWRGYFSRLAGGALGGCAGCGHQGTDPFGGCRPQDSSRFQPGTQAASQGPRVARQDAR